MPDCAQCFGCGSDNPAALHLQFFSSGDEVLADVIPPKHFEGPSAYVSQAAILAIMDEIQGRFPGPRVCLPLPPDWTSGSCFQFL